MNASDLVIVHVTTDRVRAEFLQNTLRSEGIRCELDGEGQAALAGILDIKLLVRAKDEKRAKEIIESPRHQGPEPETGIEN